MIKQDQLQTSVIDTGDVELTDKKIKYKFLITADLHIDETKRIQDTVRSLQRIEEISKIEKPNAYFIAGDVFERNKPTPLELKVFSKHYRSITACKKDGIAGNHDRISDSLTAVDWLWSNQKDKLIQVGDVKIYLGHECVAGARTGPNNKKLPGKVWQDVYNETQADILIFGHEHKSQLLNIGKPLVLVPGSIDRVTLNERMDKKYVWVVNVHGNKEISLTQYELPVRPMFKIVIDLDEGTKQVNDKFIKDDVDITNAAVKLVVQGSKTKIDSVNYVEFIKPYSTAYKLDDEFLYTDEKQSSKTEIKSILKKKTDIQYLEEYCKDNEIEQTVLKVCQKVVGDK